MLGAAKRLDIERPSAHELARYAREPGGLGLRYEPFRQEP
jgi:hypothetical protein